MQNKAFKKLETYNLTRTVLEQTKTHKFCSAVNIIHQKLLSASSPVPKPIIVCFVVLHLNDKHLTTELRVA
uniref:Uncharacterized protein n=1 Tax=Rhizophora mucronata TaxID=61149 RepID=A0A2P2N0H4_RHIMU